MQSPRAKLNPNRAGRILQYGLTGLWLLSVAFTLKAAQSPGLVRNPEAVPYPWTGVFATWLILTAEAALIWGVLRPRSFRRSWGRLVVSIALAGTLVAFPFPPLYTDMPGYYYVPGMFTIILLLGLVIFSAGLALVDVLPQLFGSKPGDAV